MESVCARRRYAWCRQGANCTTTHRAKEAGDTAPTLTRLKQPYEYDGAKVTAMCKAVLFLQCQEHRQVCLTTEIKRNSRLPIVLTLHVALPRVRCIPDKAGTAFDGVIEGLVALTSAFLLLYQWMPTLCYAGRPDNRPRISRSNTQQGQWLITQRQS